MRALMAYTGNQDNIGTFFALSDMASFGGLYGGGGSVSSGGTGSSSILDVSEKIDVEIPEVVLSGYGRKKYWGGAISTYNINHSILLNGIDAVRGAWNYANMPMDPMAGVRGDGPVQMMSGDMFGFSDLAGIGFNRVSEDHPYAAMALGFAAIVATKGKATDDVLKTETRVFRAVNDIELASIQSTGKFFVKNGLTEAKYFAKSLEDAHLLENNFIQMDIQL